MEYLSRDKVYNYQFLSEKECKIIYDYVIKNENELMSLGPDDYVGIMTHNKDGSLTGRYSYYNCLNIDVLNAILESKFKKLVNLLNTKESLYIQCWINTLRYGESISIHHHLDDDKIDEIQYVYLSGNIFIGGNSNPGTSFYLRDKIENYKNKSGMVQIFNPRIEHEVKTYLHDDVRVSIAFDIGNEEILDEDSVFYRIK